MKVFRNPDILWREEDDSKTEALQGLSRGEDIEDVGTSVLFSDGVMMSLNVMGTEIWKVCDNRTVEEIVSELVQQFDVEPDVLKKDVQEFLAELSRKDFIRYEDS